MQQKKKNPKKQKDAMNGMHAQMQQEGLGSVHQYHEQNVLLIILTQFWGFTAISKIKKKHSVNFVIG